MYMYTGIGASAGIGIGKVVVIKEHSLEYAKKTVTDTKAELNRFNETVDIFCEKTSKMAEDMKVRLGEKEAEILEGQILMIQDPSMTDGVEELINASQCAEEALETVCNMFIDVFSAADDELTRQRATDVMDIKSRMLKILLGIEEIDISAVPENTILVARDLTPSMTAGIRPENVKGILTEVGGKTSHSAILARALEIPAVLSVENMLSLVNDGDMAIVDGSEGNVIINPTEEELSVYTDKLNTYLEEKKALGKFIGQATKTSDGIQVELVGNIGTPEEAAKVVECDGEGVGLFRSEFLFMDRTSMPSEEEQFEAYKKAATTLTDKPVIIRMLDVGGDKELPYLGLEKEENPFLGYRAVRFGLERRDVYATQLRALLRASAFGQIKIMVPLVTCVDELTEVKAMVADIKAELDGKSIAYNQDVQVGVMIETAAASLVADLLAEEADFFSIGTNDLTQYTMAVDRGNAKVAYLYSHLNPAVLRSIKHIIACGKDAGIMVGMCGEAAADPLLIPLLISFGLDEFSVSPTSILATRKTISLWSKAEADALADEVMKLKSEKEIAEFLKKSVK